MGVSTKKVLGLTLVGVLTADSLTACGGDDTATTVADTKVEATTTAGDAKAENDTAADIIATGSGKKKTLCVAMECACAPYNWTQPDDSNSAVATMDSNELVYGYNVVMVKRIYEELGYGLEIVHLNQDPLILAVTTGQVDCIITGQSVTSERLQVVDFTEPHYHATIVTLIKKGSKHVDVKDVVDPVEATCTSQQSTIWYDTCLPRIQDTSVLATTVSAPDMLMSLNVDRCNLVITDQPTGKDASVAYPNLKMIEFGNGDADFQVTDEDINIGISLEKENTELKDTINSVLTKMTGDDFFKIMDEVIPVQPLAN